MNWFHVFTLVFVIIKVGGVITWSWWLVFAPSIVSLGITFALLFFMAVVGAVAVVKEERKR